MDKSFNSKLAQYFSELLNDLEKFPVEEISASAKKLLKDKYTEIANAFAKDGTSDASEKSNTGLKLKVLEKINADLDDENKSLLSLFENTTIRIWSVDKNYTIINLNSNFKTEYKLAYGVELKKGVNILSGLPAQLKEIWKKRYLKVLDGECITVTDIAELKGNPYYFESTMNPVVFNNKVIGVSCFAQDVTKQKESDEKFKLLAEISPNAISILVNNKFVYSNKSWENITGYTNDELLKVSIFNIVDKESKDIVQFHLIENQFNNIDSRRANVKIITKSQTKRWFDIAATNLKYDGNKAVVVVAMDITELYNLQETLKQNRANLLSQIENTDARIWSIDTDHKIIIANSNYKKDFKTAFDFELKEGAYSLQNLPNEMKDIWTERYNRALKGEQFTVIDEFHIEKIHQYSETSLNPIYIDKNIVGVSCFSRDISSQKQYELDLEESKNRYKTLVTNIPSIVYRCAADSDWTMEFISDEIERLTGYPASDFIKNYKRSFTSVIHPDDRLYVEKLVFKSISQNTRYDIEYRLVHENKSIRWVHEIGRATYNDKNEVKWLDGVISDITNQKKAERKLIESEEKYRSIFNSFNDIFIKTDIEGKILLVTPSVYDTLGYKPEEIIGQNLYSIFKDSDEGQRLLKKLSERVNVKDFEVVLNSHDGNPKIVSLNSRLIKDEFDKPVGIEGVARDITLRKVAEQSLFERTKELYSIFDNTPVILMLINNEGKILNINRAGAHYNKLNQQNSSWESIGNIFNCIYSIKNPQGCGNHESCEKCFIRKTIQTTFDTHQKLYKVEGILKIKLGEAEKTVHFLISTTYIESDLEPRILLSLDDITEMKEAQKQIRKLSTALDQSTATVVITDTKGNIEYANPQFEKTTGYSLNEVLGKNPRILKSNKTTSIEYKNLWETILKGETWKGEFLNVRKDKTEYWESAIISPIFDEEGDISSFIAIKENITERKRMENELKESERELRQRNDEKSRYFSILAHDLRGMVGSYHAYTDLLHTHFDAIERDEMKEQILTMVKSSGDSLQLLDNLLEWARASLGKTVLSPLHLKLNEEIDEVLKLLTEIAGKKQITLRNNLAEEINIYTDSNVLQTIIRNLVNNAIKFTSVGGTVTVNAKKINLKEIEISVEDTGIGMDEDTLSKLFKAGEKITQEGTNHEIGTGLGLMICDELVRRLGGKIGVESQLKKGSRFYFSIPQGSL